MAPACGCHQPFWIGSGTGTDAGSERPLGRRCPHRAARPRSAASPPAAGEPARPRSPAGSAIGDRLGTGHARHLGPRPAATAPGGPTSASRRTTTPCAPRQRPGTRRRAGRSERTTGAGARRGGRTLSSRGRRPADRPRRSCRPGTRCASRPRPGRGRERRRLRPEHPLHPLGLERLLPVGLEPVDRQVVVRHRLRVHVEAVVEEHPGPVPNTSLDHVAGRVLGGHPPLRGDLALLVEPGQGIGRVGRQVERGPGELARQDDQGHRYCHRGEHAGHRPALTAVQPADAGEADAHARDEHQGGEGDVAQAQQRRGR